jgi:hypothetical protein
MRQISHSSYAVYSVASAAQMLQGDQPNLDEIKLILRKAAAHGFDRAKYFELMLTVLASNGFSMEEIFSVFKDLFDRKQPGDCERTLMNVDNIPFF